MNMIRIFTLLFLLCTTSVGIAGTLQYTTENGAIDGYDPVSYFTAGQPQRGSEEITAQWNGATWHFTSAEHRHAFIQNPEQFAPQYGGFCALGMAHGGDVPTDPTAWTIWEGKLYLNMINEVSITWRYNPERLIPRADKKWAAMNANQE
jgi:YHS domain-containing protein